MSDFRISLDKANAIIAATFAKGKEAGMKPLSCVVVDAGGHVIAAGTPEEVSRVRGSYTGRFLAPLLAPMPVPTARR